MKKALALILSVSLFVTLVTGCKSDNNIDPTESNISSTVEVNEIVVSSILSLSGEGSLYGNAEKEGIELAIEQINASGGISNRPLKLTIEDDKSDPNEAQKLYGKMDEETIALIGSTLSSTSEVLATESAKNNLPMITPSASLTSLTQDKKSVFQVACIDEFQSQVLSQISVEELKATKFAVLYNESNLYSSDLTNDFELFLTEQGYDQISKVSYTEKESSFKSQISTITEFDPDVLFIPDYQEKALAVATAARNAGINAIFLGSDSWDQIAENNPEQKEILDGAYYITGFSLSAPSSSAEDFSRLYGEKYEGRTPSAAAAYAYDSVYMIKQAIELSGSTDKEAIINKLSTLRFEGVSGTVTFSGSGLPKKDAYIMKISDGQGSLYKEVYQIPYTGNTTSKE